MSARIFYPADATSEMQHTRVTYLIAWHIVITLSTF